MFVCLSALIGGAWLGRPLKDPGLDAILGATLGAIIGVSLIFLWLSSQMR